MSGKQKFPRDRFDEIAVGGKRGTRLGAHRSDPRQRVFWRWFLAVVSLTLVCSLAGVLWLMRVGADSTVFSSAKEMVEKTTAGQQPAAEPAAEQAPESAPQPAPEPAPQPEIPQPSPETTVAVLNGTYTPGLAGSFGEQITAQGWGTVTLVGNAENRELTQTRVLYARAEDESQAQALAHALGVAAELVPTAADYGAVLVVEVGADRAGQ